MNSSSFPPFPYPPTHPDLCGSPVLTPLIDTSPHMKPSYGGGRESPLHSPSTSFTSVRLKRSPQGVGVGAGGLPASVPVLYLKTPHSLLTPTCSSPTAGEPLRHRHPVCRGRTGELGGNRLKLRHIKELQPPAEQRRAPSQPDPPGLVALEDEPQEYYLV